MSIIQGIKDAERPCGLKERYALRALRLKSGPTGFEYRNQDPSSLKLRGVKSDSQSISGAYHEDACEYKGGRCCVVAFCEWKKVGDPFFDKIMHRDQFDYPDSKILII